MTVHTLLVKIPISAVHLMSTFASFVIVHDNISTYHVLMSKSSFKIDSFDGSAQRFPYGLVVRIPAFHAGGPGSIPGVGARTF